MADTPIKLIHGPAGTGKTFAIRNRMKKEKGFAKLCATTGIAAINLGDGLEGECITTLNSALAYFDSQSLKENLETGKLTRILKSIKADYKYIVVDEASMLDCLSFDCLVMGLDFVNAEVHEEMGETPLGLILVGDFLQLPPVEGEFAFVSENWPRVVVKKLTEIKRQTDPKFQALLGYARNGDGVTVAKLLKEYGCLVPAKIESNVSTVIHSTNKEVDVENDLRFKALLNYSQNKVSYISTNRWGREKPEWKKAIPDTLPIALGAYVMILTNDLKGQGYANGDCGIVTKVDEGKKTLEITLKRGNKIVTLTRICRQNLVKDSPQGFYEPEVDTKREYVQKMLETWQWEIEQGIWDGPITKEFTQEKYEEYLNRKTAELRQTRSKPSNPYYDCLEKKWVIGEVVYMPIRLAYASTVHKCQGLTLDSVQIVLGKPGSKGEEFFRNPSMLYVALSRARTLEGLRVIGTMQQVEKACNISKRLIEWI